MFRKAYALTFASALALCTIGIGVPSAATAEPRAGVKSCITGTTYNATGRTTGWGPTTLASNWALGPQTISFSQSQSATQTYIYSGSVTISATALGVSAEATYGVSYSPSLSTSTTWTYSAPVPSGKTGRLLALHRMDRINFTAVVDNANCTTTTTTGLVAYLPTSNTSSGAYCWIMDITPAKTNWSSTCSD
jgi:hypothetical protein